MSSFMESIASSTFVNGLPSRSKTNSCIILDERTGACSSDCKANCRTSDAALPCRSLMRDGVLTDNCKNRPVAPLDVAWTLPNVLKALSLSRIAIASAMAASSCARNMLRCSYSLAFVSHMGTSFSRKASSSAFCFSASWTVSFFCPKLSSFSLIVASLFFFDSSRISYSSFFVARNSSCALIAAFSADLADSRLDPNVSFNFLRTPTISPDCADWVPASGDWSNDSAFERSSGFKNVFAANNASLMLVLSFISNGPLYPAMNR
mmetsp:Transcript_77225/g.153172  ORF Transcript_77225/g.153172 Transcript_77225/m.153172 type:complete len:264 (+) Transcript_77225:894-1685(+)